MPDTCCNTELTAQGAKTPLMRRRELLIGLAAGTVLPLASGCAENQALGRSQLMLVSDSQLTQMSNQAWQDTLREERVLRDPSYQRRLERVGQRIVPASGLTRYNWEYVVFDSEERNAWVLPNGKVGFYKGILDIMEGDGHIATVLGHEIAHVAGRHSAERASQQLASQVGISLLTSAVGSSQYGEYSDQIGAALGMGATYGIILPYSREHEYEADRIGVDYMVRAGYNPRDALDFWIGMAAMNQTRRAEFSSTHPSDENRIAAMRQHMQSRGYI